MAGESFLHEERLEAAAARARLRVQMMPRGRSDAGGTPAAAAAPVGPPAASPPAGSPGIPPASPANPAAEDKAGRARRRTPARPQRQAALLSAARRPGRPG
eukprot:1449343-Alexandrium_andersonii.AAC.1